MPGSPALRVAKADPPGRDDHVEVPAGGVLLPGHLNVPEEAKGIVVFAPRAARLDAPGSVPSAFINVVYTERLADSSGSASPS
jgi:hypothetical protein